MKAVVAEVAGKFLLLEAEIGFFIVKTSPSDSAPQPGDEVDFVFELPPRKAVFEVAGGEKQFKALFIWSSTNRSDAKKSLAELSHDAVNSKNPGSKKQPGPQRLRRSSGPGGHPNGLGRC